MYEPDDLADHLIEVAEKLAALATRVREVVDGPTRMKLAEEVEKFADILHFTAEAHRSEEDTDFLDARDINFMTGDEGRPDASSVPCPDPTK